MLHIRNRNLNKEHCDAHSNAAAALSATSSPRPLQARPKPYPRARRSKHCLLCAVRLKSRPTPLRFRPQAAGPLRRPLLFRMRLHHPCRRLQSLSRSAERPALSLRVHTHIESWDKAPAGSSSDLDVINSVASSLAIGNSLGAQDDIAITGAAQRARLNPLRRTLIIKVHA